MLIGSETVRSLEWSAVHRGFFSNCARLGIGNLIHPACAFGEQTRRSVETFQSIFKLPVTGVVDFATWYAISNIYVAVERLAELV